MGMKKIEIQIGMAMFTRRAMASYAVVRWAVVGCILALYAGCTYLSQSHVVEFSPDGRFFAYVIARQWDLPLPPEMPTIRSTVYVMWRALSEGSKTQRVKIDSFGREFGYWGKDRVHLAFAPDSRHLSVVSPRRLPGGLESESRLHPARLFPAKTIWPIIREPNWSCWDHPVRLVSTGALRRTAGKPCCSRMTKPWTSDPSIGNAGWERMIPHC